MSAEIESNSGISSGPVSPNELNESSGISEIKLTEGKKLNNKKKRKLISLECLECGQTFKQQRTFKKHLLRHVKQPLVATQRCDQSQLYSEALRRSTRLSTKPMPAAAGKIRLIIRHICKRTLYNYYSMIAHFCYRQRFKVENQAGRFG